MTLRKEGVRFGGGTEPIVTGMHYRIPFGGHYTKYDDGGKVFKFFSKDNNVRYSAQLFKGIWHVKVEVFLEGRRSCLCPVSYFGRDANYHVAFDQVREEIREHRAALKILPTLK